MHAWANPKAAIIILSLSEIGKIKYDNCKLLKRRPWWRASGREGKEEKEDIIISLALLAAQIHVTFLQVQYLRHSGVLVSPRMLHTRWIIP